MNNQSHFNNFFNNLFVYGSEDTNMLDYSLCNIHCVDEMLNNFIKDAESFLNSEKIRAYSDYHIYKNFAFFVECIKNLKVFILSINFENIEREWFFELKGKLITFLNILVIELYEYYTKIKFDEPIYNMLNNFYKNLLMETHDIINQKDKDAEDKKIEEKNEINININMNNTTKNLTSRNRYLTYHTKNKNEINNGNQLLTSRDNYPRKTVNLPRSKAIREDKNKLGFIINNSKTIFNNLKKEKPIKLGNQYHQEENQIRIKKIK